MPNTNAEWRKRVRGCERVLRDAKRSRRYIATAQLCGIAILGTGITLSVVLSAMGWLMLGFLGLGMFAIASAMAAEWTLYQDVTVARDRLEDVTAEYEDWKLEQATATVDSFGRE